MDGAPRRSPANRDRNRHLVVAAAPGIRRGGSRREIPDVRCVRAAGDCQSRRRSSRTVAQDESPTRQRRPAGGRLTSVCGGDRDAFRVWIRTRRACRRRLAAHLPHGHSPGVAVRRTRRRVRDCGLETAYAMCDHPTARRSAARARRRVESSVGSGEFASSMISGISVQPRITASQPSSFRPPITF